jgi:RNA polymerase sigma factor (sigma-70 family)
VLTQTIDRERVATAYTATYATLRYIAERQFRIPEDDARELIHDAFVSFMRHHHTIADDDAWLVRTTSNACIDWTRRHRPTETLPESLAEPSRDVNAKVDVLRLLSRLSARCRDVLWRRFVEHESAEEIAISCSGSTSGGYGRKLVYGCLNAARAAMNHVRGRA